ncbi:metallophosphoesterase family protein [Thermosphaera chiliense]|uniref:metallophosphoesterase family protein n=1 Tax=Thermosphaera chiliense TaxID=3402707 RepID=UPI001D0B34CC|nr:metallophosphoesterase family protein [Thermosphaera aggregans]
MLSDIHGNMDALQALMNNVPRWDEVWVLGDLVDYGPEPYEVIDYVRSLSPRHVLRGNHDHAVAFGVDCGCGERTHDLSVYTRVNISMKKVSKEHVEWLKSLSPVERVAEKGLEAVIVHGSPRNPLYDYMLPDLSFNDYMRMLTPSPLTLHGFRGRVTGLVVSGHTHIPMDVSLGDVRIVNPGSVGQPRDGDPRASCGLLDTETMEFRIIRVKYDVDKVLSKLRALITDGEVYQRLASILLTGKV